MLQIMSKVSPIPWPELTLPEGRTVKACQVMIDKEKAKLKKAREEAGESTIEFKANPKVRAMVAARLRDALNIDSSAQGAAGKRKKGAAADGEEAEKPAKKVRKGKKVAELDDEEGEVEAPKKKGGAKKGGKKAAAAVKAEEDVPASDSAEPETDAAEQVKEEAAAEEA